MRREAEAGTDFLRQKRTAFAFNDLKLTFLFHDVVLRYQKDLLDSVSQIERGLLYI